MKLLHGYCPGSCLLSESPLHMSEAALVTGGAGFIGFHLSDDLLARGYHVRALDALSEQVTL